MSHQEHTAPVEYRQISRYVGYRFGDDGSFWSCWIKVRRPGSLVGFAPVMTDRWTRCYGAMDSRGYIIINPKDSDIGRSKSVKLHRVILEAFLGPCPPGCEACHNDGNRANNCIANLRWDSSASNSADTIKHGRSNRGERNTSSKLKESDIPRIFDLWRNGRTKAEIARMYGTSGVQICNIINRKSWSHVQV